VPRNALVLFAAAVQSFVMSRHSDAAETLLIPRGSQPSTARTTQRELPPDLQQQAAGRLRALALLYAFVFFMAGFLPALLFADTRAMLFSHAIHWLPGSVAIAVALVVAGSGVEARNSRSKARDACGGVPGGEQLRDRDRGVLSARRAHDAGKLHGAVVGGGLDADLHDRGADDATARAHIGGGSGDRSAGHGDGVHAPVPAASSHHRREFLLRVRLPLVLVVVMASVGSRVVYALGTEVRRARELGSYRLVERLGAGGMGEVWRAKHRLLARPAAIKLIRPLGGGPSATAGADAAVGPVSDTAQRRFEREAQVTASLRSPHTVNLFDFGMADDGAFYYVMELLEGLDCERLVKRFGPQPAERVIHILRQMCHSLSEAESLGLVHRDIKPGNVFLCHYGRTTTS
jgi:serine/threonine-protein kinase